MSTIHEKYSKQAARIPAPNRETCEQHGLDFREVEQTYFDLQSEIRSAFSIALADHYLTEIDHIFHRLSIGEALFAKVWKTEHFDGFQAIEEQYKELAQFTVKIYKLSTDHGSPDTAN